MIDTQIFKLARGACFTEGEKVQFVEFQEVPRHTQNFLLLMQGISKLQPNWLLWK